MAYHEMGHGDPIVFLHGNGVSSFTWRKIVALMKVSGRYIAPDLVGMGLSDKLSNTGPETYIYSVHRRYIDALLSSLKLSDRTIFITQGWGCALACDWSARHPGKVMGLCYMEPEISPLTSAAMDPVALEEYKFLRSRQGEALALKTNYLLDKLLFTPLGALLDQAERETFLTPFVGADERRRALLEWEREVPINGIPADTFEHLSGIRDWLATSAVPKLFVKAEPGFKTTGERLEAARAAANQEEIRVSAGAHPQEEAPGAIAEAVGKWIEKIRT